MSYQITATTLMPGIGTRKATRITTSRPTARRALDVVRSFQARRMADITIGDAEGKMISEDDLKRCAEAELARNANRT